MSVLQHSAVFVMRELVAGALKHVGGSAGEMASEGVVRLLNRQFLDHSQSLTRAFRTSTDRAWRALEISLQGDSWWGKVKGTLASADERGFAAQIQCYLAQVRLGGNPVDPRQILEQLRAARRNKHLDQGAPTPGDLARHADQFARHRDPTAQLEEERRASRAIADHLRRDYPHLAAFLSIQAGHAEPLFAVAVRYFFRRAVEEDAPLARGLAFAQFEKLSAEQEQAFGGLHQALTQMGDRLASLLDEIKETVTETHGAVMDIRGEQARQGDQMRLLYDAVIGLQQRLDLSRAEVRPRDSLSIRGDEERRVVKQLVAQYRSLPPEQRRQMPALLNGIGKLEVAAGDFQGAAADFKAVAQLVGDPRAQAEAHYNAYRASLGRRDWEPALRSLLAAVAADPGRFNPFPTHKYVPRRILGAGGFGVAFLCEHAHLKAPVVVKTLADADLDRGVETVFAEAIALQQLNHPSIIRVQDCDFADPARRARPYLVMDYFEGQTLEEAAQGERLGGADLLAIIRRIAEGLQAAHQKNVLHRDIKPANVLVRKAGGDWEVKIIDFGLAVRQAAVGTAAGSTTLIGSSIAGTIDYAAPEQMGRLSGVPVSARSDIYGFARTCCYAMFATPTPLNRHWKTVGSTIMVDLLEECLHDRPEQRPESMKVVLDTLARVKSLFKKGARPSDEDDIPYAVAVEDIPPPPDRYSEADALLGRLVQRFDPQDMARLGGLLGQARKEAPSRFRDLLGRARAVAESAAKGHIVRFQPLPGNAARSEPVQAAALTWHLRLSLWDDTPKP